MDTLTTSIDHSTAHLAKRPSILEIAMSSRSYFEQHTFECWHHRLEPEKTPLKKTANEPRSPPMLSHAARTARLEIIRTNQRIIREQCSAIETIKHVPRTQANNRKCSAETVEEAQAVRADVVAAQLRAWRAMLPSLLKKLSRISEPRCAQRVKHKLTMLLLFGLFAFVFQLTSRREMNRELTGPLIYQHLQKIFPEMDSIPHADSLARLLERINPVDIEAAHIELIRDLINNKKFQKLLIHDCLPVSVDGTQKYYRDGTLQDPRWCERHVGSGDNQHLQQYLYTIEANITFKNGLNIPLMSEYLYRGNDVLNEPEGKQDSETTAFERLAKRLKKYFPRLKIIFFMDAMYATQSIMELLKENGWQFSIHLPKQKLKSLAEQLNKCREKALSIPEQPAFRNREQTFYWENNIISEGEKDIIIHVVACAEKYTHINKETVEIETCNVEHAWISSIALNINNVHELLNLGARNNALIEDSMNTEKNRGYQFKHAFSYDWNAAQGFHYLMRLGHAINALSEFTKKLKQYVKSLGVRATLKLIKETIFSPWLPLSWYEEQKNNSVRLEFQLE